MKKISLACALFLSLSGFVKLAVAQDPRSAKLDSLFKNAARIGVFNGNVLVTENGKTLYQASFGYADGKKTTNLTPSYRFNIGSIAKEFNEVAIMMLQEKGKLALSDQVSKHIKDMPKWADSISILNLLQYTSGLPNSKWNEINGDADNLRFLKTVAQLDFKPGTKYVYNNNNVFLQRQIVESITKMPFNDFVKEKMLKPLGMNESIVDPTVNDAKIARAFNSQQVEDPLTPPFSGWTNVTLGDFYKWANAINNFKLITPASTRTILYGFAPGNQSGLGRGTMDGNKLTTHVHDGTAGNYQALLVTAAPKNNVTLLLTNNKQGNLYTFNRAIEAILAGKPINYVKKSFSASFKQEIAAMNATQVLSFYDEKKKASADEFDFDTETSLNDIGYSFLKSGKSADALLIFKKNTELFPTIGNAWDSLAEATLSAGDKVNALIYYRKAYALDPSNEAAKKMIADLSK
jgi:CubicO group peptidase (beta-lactamase class C family)